MNTITIVAFYKFVDLPNFQELRAEIYDFCKAQAIKGTILLGREGINSTISGLHNNILTVLDFLKNYPEFADLTYKVSYNSVHPFIRLKVKLKKEIVTLGIPNINPAIQTGEYVEPTEWNALIADPNVITIDTRNKYETHIGAFKHAMDPKINNFRDFPEFFEQNFSETAKKTKIAMYCTGGIRCEKSTAYLLQLGFENVYHLKGGILNYLANIEQSQSLWQGECFVFDDRVGVNHDVNKGVYDMCHGCRYPISAEDQQSVNYKPGVYCPNCYSTIPASTIKRAEARQKQITLQKTANFQRL